MLDLGTKDSFDRVAELRNLRVNGQQVYKPDSYPSLAKGDKVVAGLDRRIEERLFVCNTFEDMLEAYGIYARGGWALGIRWYVLAIEEGLPLLTLHEENVRPVVEEFAPDAPLVVQNVILYFASGNPGVARILAQRATNFTEPSQVEELVGWPMADHTDARASTIWDKFRDG